MSFAYYAGRASAATLGYIVGAAPTFGTNIAGAATLGIIDPPGLAGAFAGYELYDLYDRTFHNQHQTNAMPPVRRRRPAYRSNPIRRRSTARRSAYRVSRRKSTTKRMKRRNYKKNKRTKSVSASKVRAIVKKVLLEKQPIGITRAVQGYKTHDCPSGRQFGTHYNSRWPLEVFNTTKLLFNGDVDFTDQTKIDINSSIHRLEVYNHGALPVDAVCYYLEATDFHDTQPLDAWLTAWNQFNGTNEAVGDQGAWKFPGDKPYYPAFSKYFKIKKTVKTQIQGGATVNFVNKFSKTKTLNLAKMKKSNTAKDFFAFVPRLTCSMVLVTRGQVVTQNDNAAEFTYAAHKLTIFEHKEYKIRCPDLPLTSVKTKIITTGLGAGAADIKIAYDYTQGDLDNQNFIVNPRNPATPLAAAFGGDIHTGQ